MSDSLEFKLTSDSDSTFHLFLLIAILSGTRPYACSFEQCDRSFSDRTNLKRHLQQHLMMARQQGLMTTIQSSPESAQSRIRSASNVSQLQQIYANASPNSTGTGGGGLSALEDMSIQEELRMHMAQITAHGKSATQQQARSGAMNGHSNSVIKMQDDDLSDDEDTD